eukprot:TRINITY_DN2253_c2_g2_i1.p1 TRINITY_DN2253_c2_g2~~TRINITY_DN2253_c2_g2_i1.p1  ORF type:complete len:395 (+),score=49.75 TRINITY_DN2253_c2_g2_i1:104-1186(+)
MSGYLTGTAIKQQVHRHVANGLTSIANGANSTLGVESCPSDNTSSLPFPSTCLLSCVIAVGCFISCLTILRWYNFLLLVESDHGTITERTAVYTPLTSNTHWAMFFAMVCLKSILDALMYGVSEIAKNKTALAYANFTDLVLHSLTSLSLSWALLYQFKHRSGQDIQIHSDSGSDSSGDPGRMVFRVVTSAEAGLLYLALVHIVVAWWAVPDLPGADNYSNSYWVYVAALCTQRLPLVVIGVLLVLPSLEIKVAHPTNLFNPNSYPSSNARWLLGVGILIGLPHTLPATTWTNHILSSPSQRTPCPLWVFSWYDIILLLYIVTLSCYFSFLRLEFNRVKEQELYSCHVEHTERSNNRRVL